MATSGGFAWITVHWQNVTLPYYAYSDLGEKCQTAQNIADATKRIALLVRLKTLERSMH